jgi:uncharacterized integral membrane protein
MVRVYLVVGLAAVIFSIYAVIDCAMTDHRRARGIPKPLWVLVILLLPVIGAVLWFVVGKDRSSGKAQRQDERIRKLEQELAELDDDSKD